MDWGPSYVEGYVTTEKTGTQDTGDEMQDPRFKIQGTLTPCILDPVSCIRLKRIISRIELGLEEL